MAKLVSEHDRFVGFVTDGVAAIPSEVKLHGRARFVDKQLAFADTLPAEMRASLLHDLEAGGKLEAPWLCGAVARMAAENGLQAPVNRAIYAALKPYVDGSPVKAA